MNTISFKIRGMDCAEEVSALRRVLQPIIADDDHLSFDLLNARLTVQNEPDSLSGDTIIRAVAKTGMTAIPWQDYVAGQEDRNGFWGRRGPQVMCAASATAMVLAGVVEGVSGSGLAGLFGGEGEAFRYSPLGATFLAVAIAAGSAYFVPKAYYALRAFRADINLLVVVAIIGALCLGEWFEAAMVAFLFSVALLLETWSVGHARNAITSLMDLAPETARCRETCSGETQEVVRPVADVALDAAVLVRPGERIPLDGIISEGVTNINQAPITGESMPVSKGPGDGVFAGTINEDGAITFRVTKLANDSSLARIIRMVEEAQGHRAPAQQSVENFALYYTPVMMALALLIAVLPPMVTAMAWSQSIYMALVMLLIACPCALVISTPVSIVAGITCAARHGVLIKGGAYLEAPARIRAMAFDKTGTLTRGEPAVQQVIPMNGHSEDDILRLAASIESLSMHPLGQSIVRYTKTRGLVFEAADSYRAVPGKGAEAVIKGNEYWLGSHRLLLEHGRDDPAATGHAKALEDAGRTVVMLGCDDHVCGLIAIADGPRPESAEAIAALKRAGVGAIVMLTGDNEGTARSLAAQTGIESYYAELLPEDKVAKVRELTKTHGKIAMVGDGINDAPAMASAHLAIAMGAAGSDAAIETADVALMADDLSRLPWLVHHAKSTLRIIKQNIVVALGLKGVVFLLALADMATLSMAIFADMGASILVILNGLRLLRR
jgi:Cd2+/Zn2+-exporting ATPase